MDIRKQIEESIEVKKVFLDMDNIIREVEDVIRDSSRVTKTVISFSYRRETEGGR